MLIDVTKCIGCQGCQVACKNWNDKPANRTTLGGDFGSPTALNSKTFTTVKFSEGAPQEGNSWHFTKQQCMHCVEPACAAACACGALKKSELGPVEYDEKKCIGCRYCMLACPFGTPTFEWEKALPTIQKCEMCSDRIKAGIEPACSKTCAPGAILFGDRNELIGIAEGRIAARPDKYIGRVYGKDEAGGTSIMYISDTDFANLELTDGLENSKYSAYSWNALAKTPAVGVGAALLMAGFFFITNRKDRMGGNGEGK